MSSSLKNYLNQLKFFVGIKNKNVRDQILKQWCYDDNFFNSVEEIVENTMKKTLPIKARERRMFIKYKNTLSEFIKPSIPKRKRKKLVIQSGGFLQIFIPILTSFLAFTNS